MSLVFREWRHGDCARLVPRSGHEGIADLDALAAQYDGPAWTAEDGDGRVLACFGWHGLYGVASLWSMLGQGVERHPVALCKMFRACILRAINDGAHRVDCLVLADDARARAWAERVGGMRCEGVLRKYGADKRDRAMYAICTEDM